MSSIISNSSVTDPYEQKLLDLEAESSRKEQFDQQLSEWFNYLLSMQHHVTARWRILKLNFKPKNKPKPKSKAQLKEPNSAPLMEHPVTKRIYRFHERMMKDLESELIRDWRDNHKDLVDQIVPLSADTMKHLKITPATSMRVWNTESLTAARRDMKAPMAIDIEGRAVAAVNKKKKRKPTEKINTSFSTDDASVIPAGGGTGEDSKEVITTSSTTMRISYAAILFDIRMVALLCRSPAVGPDGYLIYNAVLPRSLQTSYSRNAWVKMPEFNKLAPGLIRRMRLLNSRCTKERRSSDKWPTRQSLHELRDLAAGICVFTWPEAALKALSDEPGRAEPWADDEKIYHRLHDWEPEAAVRRREEEKQVLTELQQKAAPSNANLNRKDLLDAIGKVGFHLIPPKGVAASSALNSNTTALNYGQPYRSSLEEGKDLIDVKQSEEEERKADEAERVKQNRGRFWGDGYHPAQFLNEIEALFHHLELHDFLFLNYGGLSPVMPFVIDKGQTDRLIEIMKEEAQVESETDDFQRNFATYVYEETLGMECRTVHRNGLLTDILNNSGGGFASLAKAKSAAKELLKDEFGYHFSENLLFCTEDKRLNFFNPDHDLHDLFMTHFFCHTFQRASFAYLGLESAHRQGVDFMGRYFIPQHMLEEYGRKELQKVRRDGDWRRPLVVNLRNRYMVHDFIQVKIDELAALKLKGESGIELSAAEMHPKQLKKYFHTPVPVRVDAQEDSNKKFIGIWFDMGGNHLQAFILWLGLLHWRYDCELEDGTEMLHLTRQFFGMKKKK